MTSILLTAMLIGNPYQVVEPNPYSVAAPNPFVVVPVVKPEQPADEIAATYAAAVKNGAFLVWMDETPYREMSLDWDGRLTRTVITISGPFHGGRHIVYATLKQATVPEVKSALEASKAWWDAERTVGQTATRAPIGHTHTCPQCGTTWDHQANASHTCANCGTQQLVQDSRSRPVTVKATVKPTADPFARAVEAALELPVGGSVEVLEMVNRQRAARGLHPFIFDAGLTRAATGAATARARELEFGHLQNDFVYLPSGCAADAAGCAAYPASYGFMACCVYDSYTHAGAVWAKGADNRMYCHIFVRNEGGNINATSANYSGGSARLFWRFRR